MKVRVSSNRAPFARGAALLLLVAAGCGDDVPASQLVSVTEIAPGGADCAQRGGVSIQQGADKNKNGKLDAAEVTSTTVVCEGPQTDPKVVVNTTTLAVGNANCLLGGSQVDTGLDNGDGGGTAGNGTLEAGEIDSTVYVCNGTPVGNYDLTKPTGAVGVAHISMNGGSGMTSGTGGAGGTLHLNSTNGDRPASYAIFDTGSPDTTHTIPTLTVDLGSDGATYSANATLTNAPAPASCADQTVYIDPGVIFGPGARLVRCHAGGTPYYTVVTGLRVNAGVTLTLNQSSTIVVPRDVDIQGTVTTPSDTARTSVTINARNINIASTGLLKFQDLGGGGSGNGGSVSLSAAAVLVNRGTINASGGDHSSTPGTPGAVSLHGSSVYNVGAVSASGGSTTANAAGAGGGSISLSAGVDLVNEGALTSNGGSGGSAAGSAGNGGAGGDISLSLSAPAASGLARTLFSTGTVSANGGNCGQAGTTAGTGGSVSIQAYNARLRHLAAVSANGGTQAAAATCIGGAGGEITLSSRTDDAGWDATAMIDAGGTLSVNGANGAQGGGAGGSIYVLVDRAQGGLARLFGYASIDANGGSAATGGSCIVGQCSGGRVEHATTLSGSSGAYPTFIPEQVHIYPPVNLVSGVSTTVLAAANGGTIDIEYSVDNGATSVSGGSTVPSFLLAGAVDAHSTATGGFFGGGAGGSITFAGFGAATLSGAMNLNGNAIGSGSGGAGGSVNVSTTGDVTISGAIAASGANSAATAGRGGSLNASGSHVTVSGNATLKGGDGTGAAGRAGDGGAAQIFSQSSASTVTGTINVAAGTAATQSGSQPAALPGVIVIDGNGV
ncbi:MAG: hypothetical protein U0230_02745 [Polyangiales bacterium]